MKLDFCKFNASSSEGKPAELFFYGDIVSDSWSAWTQEDQYPMNVQQLLREIGGGDLDIHINSCGGDVFAGFAICNMLRSCGGRKRVYVDGLAASIASVIAMAGDEIVIPANAYMMIHNSWSVGMGNAADFRKMADTLDKIASGIAATYLMRAAETVNEKQIKKMMAAETWMTGAEAAEVFRNVRVDAAFSAEASIDSIFADRFCNIPAALQKRQSGAVPKPPQADVPEDMARYAKYLDTMRAAYGGGDEAEKN